MTAILGQAATYVKYINANICRANDLALRDAVRVMPGGRGECGARGPGLISLAPGRSGHHVCRHYDRHARCVAGSGPAVGGVTPAPWTVCPRNLARVAPREH